MNVVRGTEGRHAAALAIAANVLDARETAGATRKAKAVAEGDRRDRVQGSALRSGVGRRLALDRRGSSSTTFLKQPLQLGEAVVIERKTLEPKETS